MAGCGLHVVFADTGLGELKCSAPWLAAEDLKNVFESDDGFSHGTAPKSLVDWRHEADTRRACKRVVEKR